MRRSTMIIFYGFAFRLCAFVLSGGVLLVVARFLRRVPTFFDATKRARGKMLALPNGDIGESVVGERARMQNPVWVEFNSL